MKSMNKIVILNILSTIVLQGIALFSAPVFSRILGTSNYGMVSVYNTWVSVVVMIFGLQTQSSIAVARTEYPEEEQNAYQSSILALSCVSYFIFTMVMLIGIIPLSKMLNMQTVMYICMLLQGFGQFCVNFINIKFTYEFKAGKNFFLSVFTSISNILLSLLLIKTLSKEVNYLGRIGGLTLTYSALGFFICGYIFYKGKKFYSKRYWQFCLPLTIPIIFHGLSGIILNQSDRVMLQNLSTNSVVGIYSLTFSFCSVMSTIWNALNNSWVPFYYEFTKNCKMEEIKKHATNYMELFTVLSMGFILLSPEVYHIYASSDYWDGITLIPILVLGIYMTFLYTFPVNFEFYNKKTKVIACGTVMAAIMNIIMNWFMIKKYGALGAAGATAIAHGLQFMFHHMCAKRIKINSEYPFKISFFVPYSLTFGIIVVLCVYLGSSLWYVRWGMGAVMGIWELNQIRKRRAIF